MADQLLPYVPILVGSIVAVSIGLTMLLLNAFFGSKRSSVTKGEPFECGNPPAEPSRPRVNASFYLVALVFLIFDVEVVFMLPWAVRYRAYLADPAMGALALVAILLFMAILALALVYVWHRRVLPQVDSNGEGQS